jgi:hypothetical protein
MKQQALAFHTGLPLSTPLNTLMLAWLHDQGATSENLPDAWLEFLGPGNRNDLWFAYLGGLGYAGALPDREHAFWTDQRLGQFRAPLETSLVAKGLEAATATFARNSTALDKDDYASVAIDVARFSADGWFGEPQRENLCLHSRTFDNAFWNASGSITRTANAVGIDGAANTAYTITDTDAGTASRIEHTFTVADDSNPHTFSLSIGKDADETTFPELVASLSGGTVQNEIVQINKNTGATGNRGTSNGSHVVEDDGDFWRLSLTLTNNSSGNTSLIIFIRPAAGHTTLGANLDSTLTGSAVFDAAQLESGVTFATTPIHTTTAAATREADDLLYANAWDWTNDIAGSINWTPSADDQGEVWFLGNYTDANNAVGVLHDGTNVIARKRIAGVNNDATKALNYEVGTTYNIKWRLSSTEGVDIWVEEVKGTNNPTTTGATVDTDLSVGNDGNGAGYQSGSIKNLRIVRGDLTDAQVVAF